MELEQTLQELADSQSRVKNRVSDTITSQFAIDAVAERTTANDWIHSTTESIVLLPNPQHTANRAHFALGIQIFRSRRQSGQHAVEYDASASKSSTQLSNRDI
ncbi:MAG: hypothetical protein HKN47_20165 [Pirellulaceae bacterium]|nr:hypothetical protein [Pirellulaceae bacterium]